MSPQQFHNLSGAVGGETVRRTGEGRWPTSTSISDSAAACLVGNDETLGSYFAYLTLLITQTMARAERDVEDIAWVVPQNTNRAAWRIMPRLAGIAADRIWQPSLPENGHAISADTIVNLASLAASGRIRPGELVLLVVAGYGIDWQAAVLEAVEVPS